MTALHHDPKWPRAHEWLAAGHRDGGHAQFGLLGVPAFKTSLSPTRADTTPAAVRSALARYSTWAQGQRLDLRDLPAVDLGDVHDPDGPEGEIRTIDQVQQWLGSLLVAVGGDNSITYAVTRGLHADGLVTLDAHHDLRDGMSNGSPVWRLIEAGFDGRRIVQVGLSDFANSAEYARRAHDCGITVITRDEIEDRGIQAVMLQAIELASGGQSGRVHVDMDVDVCDRSVAPACPAAAPGGISAHQLRRATRLAAQSPRVVGIDFAEVDASADTEDQRTIRLVALCVLEAAAGLLSRIQERIK